VLYYPKNIFGILNSNIFTKKVNGHNNLALDKNLDPFGIKKEGFRIVADKSAHTLESPLVHGTRETVHAPKEV